MSIEEFLEEEEEGKKEEEEEEYCDNRGMVQPAMYFNFTYHTASHLAFLDLLLVNLEVEEKKKRKKKRKKEKERKKKKRKRRKEKKKRKAASVSRTLLLSPFSPFSQKKSMTSLTYSFNCDFLPCAL